MNRISARISSRINAALSTVKCPGCRRYVVPTVATPDNGTSPNAAQVAADTGERRWSFIWLPPRGEICPECFFPLERFAYRLKWIRLFLVGVALVTISVAFLAVSMMSDSIAWIELRIPGILAVIGGVFLLVGLLGILIGGHHATKQGKQDTQ